MLVDLAVPGSGPFREKERSMSTPSVEILSRAEWPGQGRREECEVSAPRAHRWGREEEKVGILSHDASKGTGGLRLGKIPTIHKPL